LLGAFYPSVGNFITVVSRYGQNGLGGAIGRSMRAATDLPVHVLTAPRWLTGVDFSDHANYWDLEYPAVMITDTSWYRNDAYHTERDTWDRLDYPRMAQAVRGIVNAIHDLSYVSP
jgi:hypothetical protein